MEQPPVRLFIAGLAVLSLLIFTGSFSYGLAASRRAEEPASQHLPPRSPTVEAGGETDQKAVHLVQSGQTLMQISRLYKIDVDDIRSANGLSSDLIKPGQKLVIPLEEPLRKHTVAKGETLWELTRRYEVALEALTAANPGLDPGHLRIGQALVIPPRGATVRPPGAPAPAVSESALAGEFAWPVIAAVSSGFGPRWGRNHSGIDLAANHGDPIKAARDGEVLLSGEVEGYGLTVVLEHEDGTRTLYAHASKLEVAAGERVKQGQVIARVGSTGNSTGPHLHFEIIVNDRPTDPLKHLPKL